MGIATKSVSIAELRRLGAMELYPPQALVAVLEAREPGSQSEADAVDENSRFELGHVFAAKTALPMLLWLARQPGVLPMELMHRLALRIAQRSVERLGEEGALSDIRVTAALAAQTEILDGNGHARSIERLRRAVRQAMLDHGEFADARAERGCAIVYAALDEASHEAGAQAAYRYLDLFPDAADEDWLRTTLRELIESG